MKKPSERSVIMIFIAIILLTSGVLMIIGACLPWIEGTYIETFSDAPPPSVGIRGIDSDGIDVIPIACIILLAGMSLFFVKNVITIGIIRALLVLVASLVVLALLFTSLSPGDGFLRRADSDYPFLSKFLRDQTEGSGFPMTIIGALLGVFSGILLCGFSFFDIGQRKRKRRTPNQTSVALAADKPNIPR